MDSLLHKGIELTPSDLSVGWQEAVTYKGTESRNIASGRLSHMTLGWTFVWTKAPLGASHDPTGHSGLLKLLAAAMPSTTWELERQAAEVAVLCKTLCSRRLHGWQDLFQASLYLRDRDDTLTPCFHTKLPGAQRQCSPFSAGPCSQLTLRVKTDTGTAGHTPRGAGKANL